MGFWLTVLVLTALVAAILSVALLRREGGTDSGSASVSGAETDTSTDLMVYRDQLAEVGRDQERGVLNEDAAKQARLEIARRILDADKLAQASRDETIAPRGVSRLAAAALCLALLGGAGGLYLMMGAPGYRDQPLMARIAAADAARADRPSQEFAEAATPDQTIARDPAFITLIEQLRSAVAERPDNVEGQMLLASNEARLGNYIAAHRAQSQVIALRGETAQAQDYTDLANLLILAAGGYVSPEAEQAILAALERAPQDSAAHYFSGLLFAQTGRPDMAFRLWQPLLERGPESAPWIPVIRARIEEIAYFAGVEYVLPEVGGPDEDALAAASEMSAEEREQMVRGMVQGLSDRLASDGGSADEWAQLIRALGVLGEHDRARAIRDEAGEVFADIPEALALIRQAAQDAGLDQ